MHHKTVRTVATRAAVCAAALCMSAGIAAAATPIALTGMPAPGIPGATLRFPDSVPTINSAGHVAFSGIFEGPGVTFDNDEASWIGTQGNLELLARIGSPVAGAPSTSWTQANTPVIGPAGQAIIKGVSTAGGGLFGGSPSDIAPIALSGTQAHGFEPGVTYGNRIMGLNINGTPRANALNQTAYTADTVGSAPGTTGGMWRGTPGNVTLVARHGAPAPGLPAGNTLWHFSEPLLNDLGQVGFAAMLTGVGADFDFDVAYFGQPGALQPVGVYGQSVPGLSGVTYAGTAVPGINNAGQVAFTSNLAGNVTSADNQALLVGTPSNVAVAVRKGDVAPGAGAGVQYAGAFDPHLGGGGHVVFDGSLAGASVTTDTDAAIFTGLPGNIRMLARESDVIPGATDGAQFNFFDSASINADGQVAFISYLQGPSVTVNNDTALFAADTDGDLFMIARTGTPLDLGNGDLRTPFALYFWGYSGGQDGQGSGLSDNGQLAFLAFFEDGTDGIIMTTVPEPSSSACLALAALAAARRRRRTILAAAAS